MASYEICKNVSCQTQKNRATRLQKALLERALQPMESTDLLAQPVMLASAPVAPVSLAPARPSTAPTPSTPVSTTWLAKSTPKASGVGSKVHKSHHDKPKKGEGHKRKPSQKKGAGKVKVPEAVSVIPDITKPELCQ